MGVAALVLGIVAIVAAVFLGPFGWIGIITGVVGIILGVLSKKKGDSMGKAGLIVSIIGTVLSVIFFIACAACVSAAGLGAMNLMNNL